MRTLALLFGVVASTAAAQGARLAVHPLELRELTAEQQEIVQAHFVVLLARTSGIRLAGSSAVEEALENPQSRDCETRDEALRFLASATDSLYAVYARVRPDPLGGQLLASARVVRSDGVVMRQVSLRAPLARDADPTDDARKLLVRLLDTLDLAALSPTLAVAKEPQPTLVRPAWVEPPIAPSSLRQPAGFALLGAGAITVVLGGIAAGLAVGGRDRLTFDAKGAVPAPQAVRALGVAREGQVATVLIPVGAVLATIGGALAWWPSRPTVPITAVASGEPR